MIEEEGRNDAVIDQAHLEREAGLLSLQWPSKPSRDTP